MATRTYLVGGSPLNSKNVWEITDDGTTLSVTNSWLVNNGATTVRDIVRDADGNFYIAAEDYIYKYDDTMTLVTTWGSSGRVAHYPGGDVQSIDVDASGYLVGGCTNLTGVERTYLYDSNGTEVWKVFQGTNPGDGFETVYGVRFNGAGDVVECHSRNSGQSTGAILNRSDGSVKQHLHARGTDAHPSQCDFLPVAGKVVLGWSALSGGGMYVTLTSQADVDDWTDKPPISTITLTANSITHDTAESYIYCGTNSTGADTIHRLDVADGLESASYDTNGQVTGLRFNADGLLIAVDASDNADEDSDTQVLRVFDSDLNKLRGWNGDGATTPQGLACVCPTGTTRVILTPSLNDMKTYSKSLVAVGANQVWYESAADTMSVVTAATDDINTANPITMVEAFEKAFIANQGNLKVLDLANSKISTADPGATAVVKGTILTGGSSGAQMVVDFADDVTDDSAALIYGKRTTVATFTNGETVTGDGGQSFVTDAAEVAHPHWIDWTPFGNDTSTYGNMPAQAYIVCLYRGRLVLAGHNHYPHLWWMSKIGNPWDWLYDSEDPLSPVAGNNVDAGEIGDIIRAMAPNGDDFLLFLCANSIWILRGDPVEGGSIDKIDDKIGVFSPWSWCHDSQRNTYFYGTGGFWKIDNEGNSLQNISFNKWPNLVDDWAVDPALHRIVVAYDPQRHGIIVNKILLSDGTNEGFFYSLVTEGLYPESYATNCGMHAAHYYESDDPSYKHLAVGGTDGFLRFFSDTKKDDDAGLGGDTAISSYFTYAPIKLADGDNQEGIAKNFCFTVGGGAAGGAYTDADGMSYEFHVGDDAETVAEAVEDGDTARESGTLSATGRSVRIRKRVRGLWFTCKCYNSTANESWTLNRLTMDIKPVGNK